MSTTTKKTKSTPHPDTLPGTLDVPAEVAELSHTAAKHVEYRAQAVQALHEAEQAVEQADQDDIAATCKAVEQGKPAPPSLLPEREEQLRDARRTLQAADEIAREAVADLEQSLVRNERDLVASQRVRVSKKADQAAQHLAAFSKALNELNVEGGILKGLLHGSSSGKGASDRMGSRRSSPKIRRNFKPLKLDSEGHLSALEAAISNTYERTAGIALLIKQAIREANRPLNNNELSAAIKVNPNDRDYTEIQAFMIGTGELVKCNEHGQPTHEKGKPSSPYIVSNPFYMLGDPRPIWKR